MIGRSVGPYVIQEEIGAGGMATVYRAYQANIDRHVAVKVLATNLSGNRQAVQRFQREAHVIAQLEHPHILPIYDYDGGHEPPYIAMRYLGSGTLADAMKQRRLPRDEVAHLVRQLGLALEYAHRRDVIHRDIKPSNILLDRQGNAFLADFGIARMLRRSRAVGSNKGPDITVIGTVLGTPSYMSPEQAQGADEIDHRSDIYALGVVLFELLTGQLPFSAPSAPVLLNMHISDPVPDIRDHVSGLPKALNDVIQRALAKQPGLRYASATEFAQAVVDAMDRRVNADAGQLHKTVTMVAQRSSTQIARPQRRKSTQSSTSGDRNKTVSVLCASADEYAEMMEESHGRQAARDAVQTLWHTVSTIVSAHNGVMLAQDDGVARAVWGAAEAREDDARQAVRAALAIRAALRQQAGDLLADQGDDPWVPLNIGVHTGLVLLTETTTEGDLSASGATITMTRRLMRQADGAILITHATYVRVRGVFDVETDNPLRVRRSRNTIDVYRVNRAKSHAFDLNIRGVEGIETRLVGRTAELEQLQNAYLDVLEEREIRMVTVVGDAGVGKSRLREEFISWLELRPEYFRFFRGRPQPETTQQPFGLLRDMMAARFDIRESDDPQTVRHKLESGIRDLVDDGRELSDESAEETAHVFGHLLGFDLGESRFVKALEHDPGQLASRAIYLYRAWLGTLIGGKHQLVVHELENIHHADDVSLDMVIELVERAGDFPTLVLCFARPSLFERRPAWGAGLECHTRVDLRPLDRRESRRLVREILQRVGEIPRSLRDMLVERSEGNPFYLEEMIKMLIDDGVIIKDSDEVWRVEASRLDYIDVPPTLISLLQARLDRLLHPERLTLQRAAVLGRVFHDSSLAALDRADETHVEDLSSILDRLVAREFIHQRETTAFTGCVEYLFASTMIRDVVLSTLVEDQAKTYNRAAAEWLIETCGERQNKYLEQIATFHERGGVPARAAYYLARAGDQALRVSAYEQARTLFQRASALLPGSAPGRLRLSLRVGEASFWLGEYPEARSTLEAAHEMARDPDQAKHAADALYLLGRISVAYSDFSRAEQEFTRSLSLARRAGDPATLARVLCGAGELYWRQGKYEEARVGLTESLEIARGLKDRSQEEQTLLALGAVLLMQGELDEAQRLCDEVLERSRRSGDRERVGRTLTQLAVIAATRSDWTSSHEFSEQALAVHRETGNLERICVAVLNVAESAIRRDDVETAHRRLREGLAMAQQIGSSRRLRHAVYLHGWLLARRGYAQRGLALLGLGLHHPPADSDLIRDVQAKLDDLGLKTEYPEVAAGLDVGKELDLQATGAELLAELASGQP